MRKGKMFIFLWLWCLFLFFTIGANAVAAEYLRLGADPVNSHRSIPPGGRIFTSTTELWIVTDSKSGRVYRGWVPAGTEFVAVPSEPPPQNDDEGRWWKAVFIKRCGNNVLNDIYFQVLPSPQLKPIPESPQPPPMRPMPSEEKSTVCFGWGTVSTGVGMAGVGWGIGGIRNQPVVAPVVAVVGAALAVLGILDSFNEKSSPSCKASAAAIGLAGGYFGQRYYEELTKHNTSSLTSSGGPVNPPPSGSSSGGPVNPPPGPVGPVNPPPGPSSGPVNPSP